MLEMILLIKTNTWNAYNPDPIPYDYVIHTIDICMPNFIYNRASNCVNSWSIFVDVVFLTFILLTAPYSKLYGNKGINFINPIFMFRHCA